MLKSLDTRSEEYRLIYFFCRPNSTDGVKVGSYFDIERLARLVHFRL